MSELSHSADRTAPEHTFCGLDVETPGLMFHDRVHATCVICRNPPVKLTEWACMGSEGPYQPPELSELWLTGVVADHPRKRDGTRVSTTAVVRAEGRHVWTKSGTQYELVGPPHEYYLTWLRSIEREYDEANPIKMKGAEPR